MGMLPSLVPGLQEQINNINNQETTAVMGKSFLFDFEDGDFISKDGRIVELEGVEALKIWVKKILKTEKFKFKIYETTETSAYGIVSLDLVNSDYPKFFINAELQREITEALLRNPNISGVENFNFNRDKRLLVVSFDLKTPYGTVGQEVSFGVR